MLHHPDHREQLAAPTDPHEEWDSIVVRNSSPPREIDDNYSQSVETLCSVDATEYDGASIGMKSFYQRMVTQFGQSLERGSPQAKA